MNPEYNDYSSLASLLAGVGQAIATRPQKSLVRTTSTSTSTPRALEDMIMRRDTIGANNQRLLDALKGRETFGYNVGAGLANLAPVSGYGDWGVNALRAFGGAMNRPTDAAIAREQVAQEMARKDLETALAYDKAMGETQTQAQTQTTEYKDMPYGAQGQSGTQQGAQTTVPLTTKADWDYWIRNWDKDRPTESSYRANSETGRALENWKVRRGTGSAEESMARQDFEIFKDKNYLPMARNTLKGSGPITDFEDAKYTRWLSEVRDPVQLKDLTVRIIDDVARKNGWSDNMRIGAYSAMGVLSDAKDLTAEQIKQNPLRVRGGVPAPAMNPTADISVNPQTGADSEGWITLSSGLRIRKK